MMSDFKKMIPFILHCEAGVAVEPDVRQMFEKARKRGYANDPCDRGGATMCGVTLATYSTYRRKKGYVRTAIADLKKITFDEWSEILKNMYWDRCRGDEIKTQMIAVAITDWVWGSGVNGIKRVQTLLGLTPDGIVGPKTLDAINSAPQYELFAGIQKARNQYHAAIARPGSCNAKFLKGWNRRVSMITWQGFCYTGRLPLS